MPHQWSPTGWQLVQRWVLNPASSLTNSRCAHHAVLSLLVECTNNLSLIQHSYQFSINWRALTGGSCTGWSAGCNTLSPDQHHNQFWVVFMHYTEAHSDWWELLGWLAAWNPLSPDLHHDQPWGFSPLVLTEALWLVGAACVIGSLQQHSITRPISFEYFSCIKS